jgi:hypothetical protein
MRQALARRSSMITSSPSTSSCRHVAGRRIHDRSPQRSKHATRKASCGSIVLTIARAAATRVDVVRHGELAQQFQRAVEISRETPSGWQRFRR